MGSSQSSAIRTGSGKPPAPGFDNSIEIANECIVLGLSAAAAGCSDTLFASSAVAARVNVSSLIFGRGNSCSSSFTNATSVALLPVPGPANMRACCPGRWLMIACCSGVGTYSGITALPYQPSGQQYVTLIQAMSRDSHSVLSKECRTGNRWSPG